MEVDSIIPDSNLSIRMEDKSRGMVKVVIHDLFGKILLHRYHFKKLDLLAIKYAFEEALYGKYVVSITYGEDLKSYIFFI